jgi:hypothetical protein
MKNKQPRREIPTLEGWSSLPTAAAYLNVTRQRMYQMVVEEAGKFRSAHGVPGGGPRPAAYVVTDAELCQWKRRQLEAQLRAVEANDSDEGREEAAELRVQLAAVQLDAVRQLRVQLGVAAEAAEVAGDAELAGELRGRMAGLEAKVPVAA